MPAPLSPVVRDQIIARLAQGEKAKPIAAELGVSRSSVYNLTGEAEAFRIRRDAAEPIRPIVPEPRRKSTLTIPLGSAPASGDDFTMISLSHDEYARLGERNTNVVVAAQIQQDSLKNRLLKQIGVGGPYGTLLELMQALREPRDNFGAHEITHLLFSLNKQGLIRFRENKRVATSSANAALEQIECTRQGFAACGLAARSVEVGRKKYGHGGEPPQKPGDRTDFRTHTSRAEGSEIIREAISDHRVDFPSHDHPVEVRSAVPQSAVALAPTPEAPPVPVRSSYPLLASLRASFAVRAAADAKASALADAAALLEQVDPEESARLMDRALAASPETLTPLEREYLAFAEEHGE